MCVTYSVSVSRLIIHCACLISLYLFLTHTHTHTHTYSQAFDKMFVIYIGIKLINIRCILQNNSGLQSLFVKTHNIWNVFRLDEDLFVVWLVGWLVG